MGGSRRRWLVSCAALTVACIVGGGRARAGEPELQESRQAKLISKLASYDRNFKARAGKEARVLIVYLDGNVDSERTSRRMVAALGKRARVGGLPHRETTLAFSDSESLLGKIREVEAAVLYLCPGLEDEIPEIASALDGQDLLSIGARANHARLGAVVSFDVVSGKPRLIINLPRAKRQNVRFSPRLLKLAEVIR